MNWNKAKNIIIMILMFLNIILLLVSHYGNDEYILSSEKEKAIIKLLNEDGVKIETGIPVKFQPSHYLSLDIVDYDVDELKKLFFEDNEDVKRSIEFEATIFKTSEKILKINEADIVYEKLCTEKSSDIFEGSEAKKEAERVIKSLIKNKNYELQEIKFENGSYYLKYYEIYLKNKVYSNYINFVINKDGIEKMKLSRYGAVGFYGARREVCSADEALFSWLLEMKGKNSYVNIVIDDMEQGYCFEESTLKTRVVPCYRISVKDGETYYINAYTSEIISN